MPLSLNVLGKVFKTIPLCSFSFFALLLGDKLFFVYNGFSFSVQLPARQEPILDSSKYTAADVRIVSPFSFLNPTLTVLNQSSQL